MTTSVLDTLAAEIPSIALYAPNGALITGACETVPCISHLHGFRIGPEGKLEPEYADGSVINWDGQRAVTLNGEALFLDEQGAVWPMSALSRAVE